MTGLTENQYEALFAPAPCDTCEHAETCKNDLKACQAFLHYAINKAGGWQKGDKTPSDKYFRMTYVDPLKWESGPLTPTEKRLYNYLKTYQDCKGYSPSYEEIRDYFQWAHVTTACKYMSALEGKGAISIGPKRRLIKLWQ